ncbi:MAG: NUDIX hydrolase [Alphaproteobacteria bacterium]|nr:NUDIX hydrolase [Alphaproteobacteria bacterium]
MPEKLPTLGVGTVVIRNAADGPEILLVRRGKAPRKGQWSIPGGRQEWGETARQAAAREVREETGIEVEIVALIDVIDALNALPDGTLSHHYTLIDFVARPIGGYLQAGDDADEARWVAAEEVDGMLEWDETRRIVRRALEMVD